MMEFLTPSISWALLGEVFARFLLLSLLATGGAISLAPEMHRFMVGDLRLLSDTQFTSSIAIAQAAPGPNILFVTVMGWQAAGPWGALAITVGVLAPSACLVVLVHRLSQANAKTIWVRAMKEGLAPVVIGLTFATGWILGKAWSAQTAVLIFVAVIALVSALTRIAPVLLILLGAVVGLSGVLT